MKKLILAAAVIMSSSLAMADETIGAYPDADTTVGTSNPTGPADVREMQDLNFDVDPSTNVQGSLNSNIGNHDSSVTTTEIDGDTYSGQYVSHNNNSTDLSKSVPQAIAPTVTTGYDTCGLANSGGLSGPGFGLSVGKNSIDQTCERLKLTKMLQGLGLQDAAVALMMQDERVSAAIKTAYPELWNKFGDQTTAVKDAKKSKRK